MIFVLILFYLYLLQKLNWKKLWKKKKKRGKATSLDLAEGLPNPLFPPGLVWPSAAPRPSFSARRPSSEPSPRRARLPPLRSLAIGPLHFLSPTARPHAAASPLPPSFLLHRNRAGFVTPGFPISTGFVTPDVRRMSLYEAWRTTLICFRLRSCRVPFAQVWIWPNLSLSISRGRPLSEPSRVAKRALVSSQ